MLNGTRVLVTGSKGFVASHLLKALNERNYPTVAYGIHAGYDILNREQVEKTVADFKPTWIIHLARQAPSIADPQKDAEVSIIGTVNILESARKHDCGVTFTSSSAVYGNNSQQVPTPLSIYAASKLVAEMFYKFYRDTYRLHTVVFRLSTLYGFGASTVVNVITAKALKNEQIQVRGDGSQTRDYAHISDVVEALIMSANGKFPSGTYDIGTGKQTSVIQLVWLLERLLGKKIAVEHIPENENEPKKNCLNVRTALPYGFKAKIALEKGLQDLIKEMQNAENMSH